MRSLDVSSTAPSSRPPGHSLQTLPGASGLSPAFVSKRLACPPPRPRIRGPSPKLARGLESRGPAPLGPVAAGPWASWLGAPGLGAHARGPRPRPRGPGPWTQGRGPRPGTRAWARPRACLSPRNASSLPALMSRSSFLRPCPGLLLVFGILTLPAPGGCWAGVFTIGVITGTPPAARFPESAMGVAAGFPASATGAAPKRLPNEEG